MKARLNKDYTTNDGVLIPEGTEVEIVTGYCTTEGYSYECIIPSGEQKAINDEAIVIIDYTQWKDWEQIKINAAISIAQGFAANGSIYASGEDFIAEESVIIAEKLIEKLKKGK